MWYLLAKLKDNVLLLVFFIPLVIAFLLLIGLLKSLAQRKKNRRASA